MVPTWQRLLRVSGYLRSLTEPERHPAVPNGGAEHAGWRAEWPPVIRRKGDTNIRMDGLLHFASGTDWRFRIGNRSAAVLESPRALLEDIAVYSTDDSTCPWLTSSPSASSAALPNVRVEYYQVMDDISKVLVYPMSRTLTFGAPFACSCGGFGNALEGLPMVTSSRRSAGAIRTYTRVSREAGF